jgi:hypothetical protein
MATLTTTLPLQLLGAQHSMMSDVTVRNNGTNNINCLASLLTDRLLKQLHGLFRLCVEQKNYL